MLAPNRVECDLTGVDEVIRALENPIGTPRLRDIVRPGERIAVVTSDITRPFPTYAVMPALLDELYAAGVDPADVTLVFALGSHRFHTEEERRHLAGERRLIRREPVSHETKGVNDVHRSRIRERHAVRRGARRQPHGGCSRPTASNAI